MVKINKCPSNGLHIQGVQPLSVSVWPWSQEQLEKAKHTYDLSTNEELTVNIDLGQTGVGGNDTWSQNSKALGKYQIKAGNYSYEFMINPLTK
ncbi:MAG: hypothetical protein JXQ96_00055 [Cyclobacteriaceae bacterium]